MKLFTKEIDKKLFQQYSKGADLENQKVVARIFNPYGRGEWYLLNSDPEDPDYIWAIVSLFEVETGSVSRQELETIKVPPFNLNLERDLYFQPVNAKQLYDKLIAQQSERYDEGGQTKEFNLAGFLDYVYPTVNAAASMQGLVLRPDFSISDNGTKFYPYTPLLLSENGIVNEISLVYGEGEKSIGSIKFELDENEFELEFEDWMVDTEGKYDMGGYLQQRMEDVPLAKTILGRAERSGYITPEEAANPKFIWAAIETAEGHLEDEEIGSSDMTFIMKEFFDYFGDIGITTAWENSRLIVKRMDEGGIISDSEVEMLQERGVTIEQMQTLLKSKFPDSFSFALYRPKEGTFGIKKPEPDLDADGYYGIQDPSLKLYFDKFHSANYKIYQGEENTYYYFTLNDEKGNEYVGSFGFKDRGDVPKEYVTKFLVFLQQAYGQPFKVYHGVYEDGGYMAGGGETRIKIKDIPQLDIYESDVFNSVSLSVPLPEPNQNFSNPVGKVEQDYDENKSRYIKNSFTATKYDYSKKKNVNGRIKYFEEEKIGTFKSRDEAKNALLEEYFDLSNLPKEVIMAAGGKVNENDMYVVYYEQPIFGQNTPTITYASKSKKLAEERLKEQPNYNIYSKNKYKVGLASEMPVYSNFQYLNKPTKELKKAKEIIHEEKRVMNFFKGKDASFKNKFSYVKPVGYRWNNDYELVKEMSDGGEIKEGDYFVSKKKRGIKRFRVYRVDGNDARLAYSTTTDSGYFNEDVDSLKRKMEKGEIKRVSEDEYFKKENENKKVYSRYGEGGMSKKVTFDDKVTAISKRLKGTKVPARLRKDYGATYDSAEAKESAKRIAGSIRAKEMKNK